MIDTHCHLNYPPMQERVGDILDRAAQAGVYGCVVPGTSLTTSRSAINLAKNINNLWPAVGIHPQDAAVELGLLPEIRKLLQDFTEIVAVGEVGLDYYRGEGERESQRACFKAQINLAKEFSKPLIIHTREAFSETMELLEDELLVVIHSFSGTIENASQALERGYFLGLNGIITFKKNALLRDVVREIPIGKILLETDAPFLSPEGFRGQSNTPERVREVATCLAEIKGLTVDVIDSITTENAKQFFSLPL